MLHNSYNIRLHLPPWRFCPPACELMLSSFHLVKDILSLFSNVSFSTLRYLLYVQNYPLSSFFLSSPPPPPIGKFSPLLSTSVSLGSVWWWPSPSYLDPWACGCFALPGDLPHCLSIIVSEHGSNLITPQEVPWDSGIYIYPSSITQQISEPLIRFRFL